MAMQMPLESALGCIVEGFCLWMSYQGVTPIGYPLLVSIGEILGTSCREVLCLVGGGVQ
jgi:hypothetical protein